MLVIIGPNLRLTYEPFPIDCLFSDCKPKALVGASRNEKDDKRLWDVSVKLVALQDGEMHPLLR